MQSLSADDRALLVRAMFADMDLAHHQIDSFNNFINRGLIEIATSVKPLVYTNCVDARLILRNTIEVTEDHYLLPPSVNDKSGAVRPVTPMECRVKNYTYSSPLFITFKKTKEFIEDGVVTDTKVEFEDVLVGRVPVMVGSDLCTAAAGGGGGGQAPPAHLRECEHDLGGYFIVNGGEKVVISQERIATNQIYCFAPANVEDMTLEIRSTSVANRKASVPLYVRCARHSKKNNKILLMKLPQFSKYVPIGVFFTFLGRAPGDAVGDIVQALEGYAPDEVQQCADILRDTFLETFGARAPPDAAAYLKARLTASYAKRGDVGAIMDEGFLPHVGVDAAARPAKLQFLAYVAVRFMDYLFGKAEFDDRDYYGTKRIDVSGELLSYIFYQSFAKMYKDLDKHVRAKNHAVNFSFRINRLVQAAKFDKDMRNAIATGNWSANKNASARSGVSQVLSGFNYMAYLSHIRRVATTYSKQGVKTVKQRQLHNSHYGYICPAETPEGKSCGIAKNLALSCHISADRNEAVVVERVAAILAARAGADRPASRVFVNGRIVALTRHAAHVHARLLHMKRQGLIPFDASLALDRRRGELRVQTDAGRCTRPLLVVGAGGRLALTRKHLDGLRTGALRWSDLVAGGAVEYLDVHEFFAAHVANRPEDLLRRHQYCEIDPALILGTCAARVPVSHHNQAPRNAYSCSMMKQAVGVPRSNHANRFDSVLHALAYPQKPLVRNDVAEAAGLECLPAGANCIVAILCYSGFNQEDSVIVNRSALERGLFNSFVYRTYKSYTVRQNNYSETFERDDADDACHKMNKRGFVEPGTRLREGDALICKKIVAGGSARHAATHLRSSEPAVCCRAAYTPGAGGAADVKVKARSFRVPEIGDKVSSLHGQKGTIGMVYRQEDMPFTRDGVVPDVIINPHCIPSRMTLAQIIECVVGKKVAVTGERERVSTFERVRVEDVQAALRAHGFDAFGNETLHCGLTGKPLECPVFMGPTYYQRLKHMVRDKVHSRARGPMQLLTRQPREGKARNGGLRIGEMEKDLFISHGVSATITEKFLDVSDRYETLLCNTCGLMSAIDFANKTCAMCGDKSDVKKVVIPYTFKLLHQELLSMGIMLRTKCRS